MPSTISAGTTAGTAIAVAGDTTGNLAFQTNGTTTAMTINTSQNVGIGTASPDARLRVNAGNNTLQARFSGVNSRGLAISTFVSEGTADNGVTYNAGVSSDGQQVWQCGGTERMRIDNFGNLQFNSGYGSVATAYGCRAWVNFNGTGTVAIRASGNVSSVSDGGTGVYTVNFTTAMPDASYAAVVGVGNADGDRAGLWTDTFTTGSVRLRGFNANSSTIDMNFANCAIFR
jgi:hypothetical protein